MHTNIDGRAMRVAVKQSGVITRRQALALGITDRMIRHRTTAGVWSRVAPGVYSLYPSPRDRLPLAIAVAKLAATVSHESAAELHGIGLVKRGRVVVTVPHRTTNRCPGVIVHESTDLRPVDTTVVDDLPATTPERTIVDLAAVLRVNRLRAVVQGALIDRRVDLGGLQRAFAAVARRGKPGTVRLRTVLGELVDEPIVVESELERRFLDVVDSAGLPPPVRQLSLPWRSKSTGRVDFAYPEARLIIECDGRRWHTALGAFEVDRRRDNDAQLAGWRVLRLTWADVSKSPGYVASAIVSALRGRPAA